ncbi:MAG: hypothetical protein ACTHLA_16985 [Asticcacaulis sp.]|uniref:hypothetical protein n=1 Tax=Asticcacaulis sp. TaxID=1872648 RepID=UPI003F7BE5CA
MSSDWPLKSIEFIVSEAARLRAEIGKQRDGGFADDFLNYLPAADIPGIIPIGYAGMSEVHKLAAEAIKRRNLTGHIPVEEAAQFLKKRISSDIFGSDQLIGKTEIDRILRDCGRAMALNCEAQTHFFPVYLMKDQEPETIDLGAVRFHSKNGFQRVWRERYPNKEQLDKGNPDFAKFRNETLDHYGGFSWIAEANIEGCHPKIAEQLAKSAVTSAVDFLHLIIGAPWTDRFETNPTLRADKSYYHLAVASKSGLKLHKSTGRSNEVPLGEAWPGLLEDGDEAYFLSQAHVILKAKTVPNPKWPLSLRFLDGLQWYGEAVRDSGHASSVIKYVLCLERLLMTDGKEDVTQVLVERASNVGMPVRLRSEKLRTELSEKVRQVYKLRSKLVHGSLSPNDPNVTKGLKSCRELAERILKMYLVAFRPDQFEDSTFNTKKLDDWMNGTKTKIDDHIRYFRSYQSPRLPWPKRQNEARNDK